MYDSLFNESCPMEAGGVWLWLGQEIADMQVC